MKRVKGYVWMSAIALGIIILLGWTVWQNLRVSERIDNSVKSTTMLEGEYSLDGGEWKSIDNTKPINEHFHKAVFKGNFTKQVKANHTTTMDIVSKNVWYTLYDSSGEVLDEYRRSPGDMEEGSGYMAEKMINTPGYYIMTEYVQIEPEYKSDDKFTLVVEYPYELDTESAGMLLRRILFPHSERAAGTDRFSIYRFRNTVLFCGSVHGR